MVTVFCVMSNWLGLGLNVLTLLHGMLLYVLNIAFKMWEWHFIKIQTCKKSKRGAAADPDVKRGFLFYVWLTPWICMNNSFHFASFEMEKSKCKN